MAPCPKCRIPLVAAKTRAFSYMGCSRCGGRALTLTALRRGFPKEFSEKACTEALQAGWRGNFRCPLCTTHMVGCPVKHGGSTYHLDSCADCQLLWFDAGEHEAAAGSQSVPPPPDPVLDGPRRTRSWRSDAVEAVEVAPLDSRDLASALPFILGLPVTSGQPVPIPGSQPLATLAIVALIAIASAACLLLDDGRGLREFGLVAAHPLRHGGLDFVTSFFLHASVWHLVSNVYFLLIFGPAVEAHIRPWRFLALLGLSALAGDLLYLSLADGSRIPTVGASGGISGILAYWVLAFPRARVDFLLFAHTMGVMEGGLQRLSLSAWTAGVLWLGLQLLGLLFWTPHGGGVNALAHLGGAAVGAFWWWRNR